VIWLDFGMAGAKGGDGVDCRRLEVEPAKATHRGYPVEVCSKPFASQEDHGAGYGNDIFLLRDGAFIIKVRYFYATAHRQELLNAFYGVCDSLKKGQ
jgi:hypothetical protein